MRTTGAAVFTCLILIACAGCSSSSSREDETRTAKELAKAAEQSVVDQHKLLDALVTEEAWLAIAERRELDASSTKDDAVSTDKLRKLLAARHALDELRSVGLGIRGCASRLAALASSLEDKEIDENEAEDLADEIPRLRLELTALTREQKVAEKRWREAREAAQAALRPSSGSPPAPK